MPVLPWRNDADGFAFANSWTFDAGERAALTALAQPLIPAVLGTIAAVLPIPDPILWSTITAAVTAAAQYPAAGPLPVYGLCGGMAYCALDHWNTRVPIARGAHMGDQPARTAPVPTAIRNAIWQRLLDSLGPGGVLQKTIEWSILLNQVPAGLGGGGAALRNRTREEWDLIRGHIDAGKAWPIGLVATGRDVWDQHQVLVYGYENTGPEQGKLFVYENNKPSQFGSTGHYEITLDFSGPTLTGEPPSGTTGMLAGFFCSNYFRAPPVGMAKNFGEFLSWTGDPRTWMVTDGVRMSIAGAAELTALGGTAADVRSTGLPFDPAIRVRPRDGALFRERSAATVFLYAGGAPFLVPDAVWLERFGGAGQVRVVPDNTIAGFAGLPDEGTLLREWSDPKVWRIMTGVRRWVRTPEELGKWGGFPSVRIVPDGALAGITVGQPLPINPVPAWNWTNMGKPVGANVRALMGAVTARDTPTSPERPHVFVEGNDFNLWCFWTDGSAWHWLNMGKPPGVNLRAMMGAVTVMDTPTSPRRPHVFIEGNDYNLWCRWTDGSAWHWLNMGKPPGVNLSGLVGAVTVMDTPTSPQRAHVFIAGTDGNLWCRWSDGSAWHWSDMGRPSGANIRGLMGAATARDTPTSPERPHVFAECNDFNLWCFWSSWLSARSLSICNGYEWEVGQAKQVVFTTGDGHIHELYVNLGGAWSHADLTATAGAPPASSVVNGYAWKGGQAKQVVFLTGDGHIHELFVSVGGAWSHADLTAIAGAPAANSVINGYAWEGGQSKQVVFTTGDGHIHELYVNLGSAWAHVDLTAITGAPAATSVTNGYAWEGGNSKQVVFTTGDGHVHELYVTLGGAWRHADLTAAIAGAPAASSVINGYAWEGGSSKQIVFTTSDGHVHEYVTLGGAWRHADLTAIAGAPAASSAGNGYAWERGQAKQVVFTTGDGHIHELYSNLGGAWSHADLTAAIAGAPAASSVVYGYAWEGGQAKQIAFSTGDGHIHELWVNRGGAWGHADLSAITGAPSG